MEGVNLTRKCLDMIDGMAFSRPLEPHEPLGIGTVEE